MTRKLNRPVINENLEFSLKYALDFSSFSLVNTPSKTEGIGFLLWLKFKTSKMVGWKI